MIQVTFKVKSILSVGVSDKGSVVKIYALLISSPKGIDLKGKTLIRENMKAFIISSRYEDNVNFGLYIDIEDNFSINTYENLTFTVHENNLES